MSFFPLFSRVAKEVARIIALALGLDGDFFDKPEMLGEPIATLRLLHYEGIQLCKGHKNPLWNLYSVLMYYYWHFI